MLRKLKLKTIQLTTALPPENQMSGTGSEELSRNAGQLAPADPTFAGTSMSPLSPLRDTKMLGLTGPDARIRNRQYLESGSPTQLFRPQPVIHKSVNENYLDFTNDNYAMVKNIVTELDTSIQMTEEVPSDFNQTAELPVPDPTSITRQEQGEDDDLGEGNGLQHMLDVEKLMLDSKNESLASRQYQSFDGGDKAASRKKKSNTLQGSNQGSLMRRSVDRSPVFAQPKGHQILRDMEKGFSPQNSVLGAKNKTIELKLPEKVSNIIRPYVGMTPNRKISFNLRKPQRRQSSNRFA